MRSDNGESISVSVFKTVSQGVSGLCEISIYEKITNGVENSALTFAQCSGDADCTLYQVDLTCAGNMDVAVAKARLEDFKNTIPELNSAYCKNPCRWTNGSDAITAGCVDNLCKVTKWGI